MSAWPGQRIPTTWALSGVIGNTLILGTLAYAAVLAALAPERYYLAVQEDGYLEWASFWAFTLAAGMFAAIAIGRRHGVPRPIGLPLGMAAFCLFVACEEISWGQRILDYRPPDFFLEHNYQQELNFHNVLATDYRQLGVELFIAVYGILLPLLMRLGTARRWLEPLGTLAPPLYLLPAFAVMLMGYIWYPWTFTGEWIELALGTGLLFTALAHAHARNQDLPTERYYRHPAMRVAGGWLLALGLGTLTAEAQGLWTANDPARVEAAGLELSALKAELQPLLADSDCGVHQRFHTYLGADNQDGVATTRTDFFLDPWNLPYWIRDVCPATENEQRRVYLYSFGPNRRRDSTSGAFSGDDIGMEIAVSDGEQISTTNPARASFSGRR